MTTVKRQEQAGPMALTAEEKLRLYTPEEVIALKLLPGTVRSLKEAAYNRLIPCTKVLNRIMFRLDHIAAISQAGDVNPATRGRRAA